MNTKDELAKAYDPKPVEEKWGKFWLDEGLFVADPKSPKPKFSMVLPPPNVTGILHMGHALCFTLPEEPVLPEGWRAGNGRGAKGAV